MFCVCDLKKKFEWHFSGRLTFSIEGSYRLVLPLRVPETLSSSSNQGFSYSYNVHLALFVRRMTQLRSHKLIGNLEEVRHYRAG